MKDLINFSLLLLFRCLRNLIKAEIHIKEHYVTRHGVLEKVNILKIIFELLNLYQSSFQTSQKLKLKDNNLNNHYSKNLNFIFFQNHQNTVGDKVKMKEFKNNQKQILQFIALLYKVRKSHQMLGDPQKKDTVWAAQTNKSNKDFNKFNLLWELKTKILENKRIIFSIQFIKCKCDKNSTKIRY